MKPLKKEISAADKKRARDLLTGNDNRRQIDGAGYRKSTEFHSEGDIWEEGGKEWTIKDGLKQNITKLDAVKEKHLMPIFCPTCSNQMKHKFDKEYYKKHKKCYDCVIKFETELKRLGLYKQYEDNIINSDIDGIIKDFSAYIYEVVDAAEKSFITENGEIQKWDGSIDKERALESMKETIKFLEEQKRK